MNRILNLKVALFGVVLGSLISCVDRDFDVPNFNKDCVNRTATKTVQQVFEQTTTTATKYTENDIIEAYVTSSDEGGNFFKQISFIATDGSRGFQIPIDQFGLFTVFEPGRKVYVNLSASDSTYTVIDHSFLNIGRRNPDFANRVRRLENHEFRNIIEKSCERVPEDAFMKTLSISEAKDNAQLHALIEFENVQFTEASLDKNFYDPTLNVIGGATNHQITDVNGNTVIVRVSSFADFASLKIPSGSGKIRGVMTKFNNDFQFMIRTIEDVKLENDRFDVDFFPPIVGNNVSFLSSLNETFESYVTSSPGNRIFPNYINDAAVGSRYWATTTFGGNKYIQMTSFGGTPENNRAVFIIPVNFTAANNLSFQTKAGFVNGQVLKIYYSTDYVIGGDVSQATLTEITSNFTISPGQSSGYPANFTNSGIYNFPASLTGNGFIMFEYVGAGGGITTTMQIDNIVIN
ncbi:MAG: DUF5689 domain-containing protein [Flavobacterium sp.]